MRRTVRIRSIVTFALGIVLAAGVATPRVLGATPGRAVLPDGSMRFDYGRRPLPELICKPHYVCDIALDAGESVLNMAIGDSTHWIIAGGQSGPSGTIPHVFVKPTQAALDTNLVITTNKRAYDIVLRSANDAKYPRISFLYVDEDAAARAAIAQHERQTVDAVLAGTPLVGPTQADTKYKLSGEPTLLPTNVFNDGVRTFIVWKTLPNELPAVVAVGKDGMQNTNFRVVGSMYIIDNINPNYDLILAAETDRHGRPERRASIRHL